MAYRVQQSDGASAEQTLQQLWARNLNMRGNPRDKFEWFYRDNPEGPATPFLLMHDSPEGETSVVGSCGVGARRIHIEGQPHTSALFADFTVDKEHRTLMPAFMLQRALCAYALDSRQLAYAFPNDAAVGIFNRIGLKTLGRARRYVKVLRSADFIQRKVKWRPAAVVGGLAVDAAMGVRDGLRSRSGRHRLEWLTATDARFDRLFEDVQRTWRVIGDRRSSFLQWRFMTRPGVPARVAALVDSKTGDLAAYAIVVEKEPGVALVADFLARSDQELELVLNKIGRPLAADGYSQALTYFLGHPRIDAVLQRAGFSARNEAKFVIVGVAKGASFPAAALERTEDWYVTEADRDN